MFSYFRNLTSIYLLNLLHNKKILFSLPLELLCIFFLYVYLEFESLCEYSYHVHHLVKIFVHNESIIYVKYIYAIE